MMSVYFGFSGMRSTASKMTPPMISTTQMSIGVSNSTVLMKSCAKAPIIAAGKKARATASTKRRALALVGRAKAIDISF
ncbi:hypothetical protein D3C86_1523070 [compost metagenome]